MPQIDQLTTTFGSQLFWLALTFGIIYLVIGRGMLPKIQATVDMRKDRIASDLAAARAAHDQADTLEADYRERQAADREAAHALTVEAKAKAGRTTEAKLREADTAINATLESAEQAIAAKQAEALAEIEAVAVEAAQDIVAKLTPVKLTKTTVGKAVKGALDHG